MPNWLWTLLEYSRFDMILLHGKVISNNQIRFFRHTKKYTNLKLDLILISCIKFFLFIFKNQLNNYYVTLNNWIFFHRTVEPEYASIAGMFGAASIVTGIFAGIGFSYLMPVIVSSPALSFDAPQWWPIWNN